MDMQTTTNDKIVKRKNTKNEGDKLLCNSNLLFIDEDENGTEIISDAFDQEIDKSIQALDDFGHLSEEEPYVELDSNPLPPPQNGALKEKIDEENARSRTVSGESSCSSDADESLADTIKKAPLVITEVVPYQPPPFALAFSIRRRLSECREEEEIEYEKSEKKEDEVITPVPQAITPEIQVLPPTPEKKTTEIKTSNRRFIVTKTSPTVARHEIKFLKDHTIKHNSQTIHFPCSQPTRQSIQNWFSPTRKMEPHVDKQYFDTSLVEIRSPTNDEGRSLENLNENNSNTKSTKEHFNIDDVWVKRDSKSPVIRKHVHIDVSRDISYPLYDAPCVLFISQVEATPISGS